jgi:hypothetical protein
MSSPSTAPRRKSFAEQSVGDMVRSVVLLALVVGAVVALGSLWDRDQARPVDAVDYQGQLGAARDLADYRVLAPEGLGAGWVPTSVDLQSSGGTVRWHLGFLTPQQDYVGLEQADIEPDELVQRYAGGLRRAGAVQVGGESWQLYRGSVDTALVRRQGEVATVVVGTAGSDVLRTFAAALR